ncbi:MAG TPA: IS630 family transposase [Mucilaginibacter sp.]
MHRYQLAIGKADLLRKRFIAGDYHAYQLAKELKVSTKTTWMYQREFERIRAEFPDKLNDFGFYPGEPRRPHWATQKWDELMRMLPVLITELDTLKPSEVFTLYSQLSQYTYKYATFKPIFFKWIKESVTPVAEKLLNKIEPADLPTLKSWRRGNNHRLWQIAKCLAMAAEGAAPKEIIVSIESSHKTVAAWLKAYREKGLKGFDFGPNPRNHQQSLLLKGRKEKLVKLLHESPKLHALNRTSWSMRALTAVYNQRYTPQLSYEQVRWCIHQMGYKYKKSREMLTSPDPKFREKIRRIQHILQKLKPDEKFFSIDEYGPVSIKIKGGRTLKLDQEAPDWVPEKQKAKGIVICTAALELSTNQVTHFFSEKKNTFEMIRLIDLLMVQYPDQTLYLCWDAVSWHNSKILKTYIEDKPVRLAPLPASTQFLNVIESVFAGLARAVIHNSDYAGTSECKQAITQHFTERNAYFLANPKRAGRKIWGKELVKARFSDTHHTRNRNAMRGAGHQ